MTQSMDVQVRDPTRLPDSRSGPDMAGQKAGTAGKAASEAKAQDGDARAETARKGSSFLAIIEKMVAGARDGAAAPETGAGAGIAGRGAGGAKSPSIGKARYEAAEGDGIAPGPQKKGADGDVAKLIGSSKGKTVGTGLAKPAAKAGSDPKNALGKGQVPVETDFVTVAIDGETAKKAVIAKTDADESLGNTRETGRKRVSFEGSPDSEGTEDDVAGILRFSLPSETPRTEGESPRDGADKAESVKETARTKREKGGVIGVIDERSAPVKDVAKPAETGLETTVRDTGSGTAEMSISFRNDGGNAGGGMYRMADGSEGKAASFQDALAQQLRTNAQDFVRAGQIVLRDNDSGSIRLNLHPESLGQVRINLELNDRKISGRIVVSSKEAYEAFRESLDGITAAFADSGFDTAGFDLSWSGGDGGGHESPSGSLSSPFYASSIPDVMSAAFSADTETGGDFPRGTGAINVYA